MVELPLASERGCSDRIGAGIVVRKMAGWFEPPAVFDPAIFIIVGASTTRRA
jgi:hypothetical protein